MTNILITGGTGFIGNALIKHLFNYNYQIQSTFRNNKPQFINKQADNIIWHNFNLDSDNTDYAALLDNTDIVIHLASRGHQADGSNSNLPDSYLKTNVEGTRKLAYEAARRGVRRFIFLSTVKIHGEKTVQYKDCRVQRFTEHDKPGPIDPYAISKLEAENAIMDVCGISDMDFVILRPPLVYGPHVKANYLRLIRLIEKQIPLPLASITNQRSMLYVENLCAAIQLCIENTKAHNEKYLISDIDISLPELVRHISDHLDKKIILFTFPVSLLKIAGYLVGKRAVMDRLTDFLLVDSSRIRKELGWAPQVNFDEGIKRTIDWYRNAAGN